MYKFMLEPYISIGFFLNHDGGFTDDTILLMDKIEHSQCSYYIMVLIYMHFQRVPEDEIDETTQLNLAVKKTNQGSSCVCYIKVEVIKVKYCMLNSHKMWFQLAAKILKKNSTMRTSVYSPLP